MILQHRLVDGEDLKRIRSWDSIHIGDLVLFDAGVLNYYWKDAFLEAEVDAKETEAEGKFVRVAFDVDNVSFRYVNDLKLLRRYRT